MYIHPLSPLHWTKRQPNGAKGLKLYEWKGMDMDLVLKVLSVPAGFFNISYGIDDDDTPIQYVARDQQLRGLELAHMYRWVFYDKYRQAMYTTWIANGMLLRDCMYFEGMRGLLVAEKDETAEELFERITYNYKNLRERHGYALVPPLDSAKTDPSSQAIHFKHGGAIKCITGSGWSPGVGRSLGRLQMTELGEVPPNRQPILLRNLLPTISRRKNARVWADLTPGVAGTAAHAMYLAALQGKGRFSGDQGAVAFLEWWLDQTCREPVPAGFTRTEEEEEYIRLLSGGFGRLPQYATKNGATLVGNARSGSFNPAEEITDEHLQFRRLEIATTFNNSPSGFDTKFPPNPPGGWRGSENPILAQEVLIPLMGDAPRDETFPNIERARLRWIKGSPPDLACCYLITVDPKRPVEGGDPAGIIVWEVHQSGEVIEVGFWEGWEDASQLAGHIQDIHIWLRDNAVWHLPEDVIARMEVIRHSDEPLSAVESNTDGTVSVLEGDGYEDVILFHSRKHAGGHSGWYASAKLLKDSEAYTNQGLRDGWLKLQSYGTISQAVGYDGSKKDRRVANADGSGTHHFERARCILIAAHVVTVRAFVFAKYTIKPDRDDEDYVPIAFRPEGKKKPKPPNPLEPPDQW